MPEGSARVLLCGASNVRLALPELVREARARLGAPLDVVASHGHGRSYLGPSRVLLRTLPEVAPPAFWPRVAAPARARCALVADVGNDLAYGAPAARVAASVDSLVARLRAQGAVVALAGLPLAALRATGRARFQLARWLIFPFHRIERRAVLREAEALEEALAAIAQARGAHLVEADPAWYAVDPIHVRRGARAAAARALLAAFGPVRAAPAPALERAALRRLRPAEERWLGRPRACPQPACVLADGTQVSWI